jgi:hypothetical protein
LVWANRVVGRFAREAKPTGKLHNPVNVLFGTQRNGRTKINKAPEGNRPDRPGRPGHDAWLCHCVVIFISYLPGPDAQAGFRRNCPARS